VDDDPVLSESEEGVLDAVESVEVESDGVDVDVSSETSVEGGFVEGAFS